MTIEDNIEKRKIEICKAFNKKPSAGIDIIKGICGVDENLHSHIASFFITNKANLDPAAIGDYLGTDGGKEKENEKVLGYFMEQMNFQGKSFTDALRENLKAFKLPGEGQKIDRLMEAFGKQYIEQNPGGDIPSADAGLILAYAAVMLSTDSHSASIKNKMTADVFDNMLLADDGHKTRVFDRTFVDKIYADITSKKFEFVEPAKVSVEFDQSKLSLNHDHAFKKYSKESKKPWYSFLTGSTVTSALGSEKDGFARMTISEPSWFGKLIGKNSAVTIVPGADDNAGSSDLDNKLVAKTAAEFMVGVRMTTTYPYQLEEMTAEYNKTKGIGTASPPSPKAPQPEVSSVNISEIGHVVGHFQEDRSESWVSREAKRPRSNAVIKR